MAVGERRDASRRLPLGLLRVPPPGDNHPWEQAVPVDVDVDVEVAEAGVRSWGASFFP
jgi:hypothetical protein